MTICELCDQLEQNYDAKKRSANLYAHHNDLEKYFQDSYSLIGCFTGFGLTITTIFSCFRFIVETQPQTHPSTALLISNAALSFFALTTAYCATSYYKVLKHQTNIKNELLTLGMSEEDFIKF